MTYKISSAAKLVFSVFLLIFTVCMTGCGGQAEEETGKAYDVYYLNNEETKIFSNPYQTETEDGQDLLEELIGQLSAIPAKMEYEAPLSGNVELTGYIWDGEQLTINFDERYKEMDGIREVLVRAALVRTLSQVQGVKYISFTVQNEPLTDNSGIAIGTMSADTFIENDGNEINTYEKVNLRLYFTNEEGDRLVEENQRNIVYNSNISLEKLVVEKLIEGPTAAGDYPTINPSTKIVSVTVKDGICYVNLDEAFLNQSNTVTPDVAVYSITNSLVELSNINKVQISINGETSILYREKIKLTNVFERNLDLVMDPSASE